MSEPWPIDRTTGRSGSRGWVPKSCSVIFSTWMTSERRFEASQGLTFAKRLILRAVLRQVSPMVIRLVSVSDQMPLHEFHDVFRTILGWNGDLGYIVRVHGQEICRSVIW